MERIGMKKTRVLAYITITAFTFILVFGQTKELLLVGQVLCGLPWGIFSTAARRKPLKPARLFSVGISRHLSIWHG